MARVHQQVGRPFRQNSQYMAQIRFRIDTVQSAGANQPVQQGTTLYVMIAAEKHGNQINLDYVNAQS
ncbi:hypothetical protein BvCmsH65A_04035 [Escherichia coli]|nr:hypothetical protein BvCmsH65A_04035 [Escherichia coli]